VLQTKVVEVIKMHILASVRFFPRQSCCLCDNVEKYGTARQPTGYNVVHAHFMPDN